jgi:glycosyltransferase involved in cell wall biosynthesis
LKIVHVVSTLDPAGGGPPQVAVRLAAAQASLGHEVHLVFYASAADRARVGEQVQHVPNHDRIVLHPVSDPGWVERLFARRARGVLRGLFRTADFVHIHGVWGGILRAAAVMAGRAAVPYSFRPAGMLDPWSLAQKRWKKKLALALGYRALLARSAFIHVLNDDERRLIEPLGIGARSAVLPNGVFIEEIDLLPSPGAFRSAHPELGQGPFIFFLSRLHPKKGLDVLAAAFSELARRQEQAHLVVAGPDEGAEKDFLERVTRAGVADRVHVVGPLYGRDKRAALAEAACFCLPSRQEGFSVAITEAMACGLPVVISEGCHFPEVAEAGAGIIVPLDAGLLADALADLLADSTRAARMGAAGAALVRARYTWSAIAARSIALYQEIVRRPAEDNREILTRSG